MGLHYYHLLLERSFVHCLKLASLEKRILRRLCLAYARESDCLFAKGALDQEHLLAGSEACS